MSKTTTPQQGADEFEQIVSDVQLLQPFRVKPPTQAELEFRETVERLVTSDDIEADQGSLVIVRKVEAEPVRKFVADSTYD